VLPTLSLTIPVEQDIPGKLLSSRACFRLPVKCKVNLVILFLVNGFK
jgi:hypothetical protein